MFQKAGKIFFFVWGKFLIGGNGSENLKIPIIGSKMKVVVNFIYGYQNLSGEKYKTTEKKLAQSDIPVMRKIPKTTRKHCFSEKVTFRVVFWIFLQTDKSD